MIIYDNLNKKEGYRQYLIEQRKYIHSFISNGEINRNTGLKLEQFYDTCLSEIEQLENSNQIYTILLDQSLDGGFTTYDFTTNEVIVSVYSIKDYGVIAHELCHAYQFETGQISFMENNRNISTLYDISDETSAYNRQRAIEYGISFFETPNAFVNGFHYKFSNKDTYRLGLSMKTPAYINLQSRRQLNSKNKETMDYNRIIKKIKEAYIGWK